jgi:hypothetical protein
MHPPDDRCTVNGQEGTMHPMLRMIGLAVAGLLGVAGLLALAVFLVLLILAVIAGVF